MLRYRTRIPVFLTVLSFISVFYQKEVRAERVLLERLEASVNSSIILKSEGNKFKQIAPLRSQLDPLFAGNPLSSKLLSGSASDADMINYLIDDRLISLAYKVDDSEVEQEINSIQTNNGLSRAQLVAALANQGFQFEDYKELIRGSLSKRNLLDREIRPKIAISDDDIKNHFYQHIASNSNGNRAYHLQIITFTIKNYKSLKAAQDTALQTLKEIKDGERFEEAAKRISDDPSASSGGDLGTLAEEHLSKAFDQVKKLQIGEVSGILGGTEAGKFLILKLVDVKSNENEKLEKMKDQIRAQLTTQEFAHQISIWLDRQRQTAFIHRAGESTLKALTSAPVTP